MGYSAIAREINASPMWDSLGDGTPITGQPGTPILTARGPGGLLWTLCMTRGTPGLPAIYYIEVWADDIARIVARGVSRPDMAREWLYAIRG